MKECWDWADETFNCCDDCVSCGSDSKPSEAKEWERECHSQLCDTVYDVCNRVHSNTTDCLERADHATHCCYSCLDCPTAQLVRGPHTKQTFLDLFRMRLPKNDSSHNSQCASKVCNAIYEACTESDHSSGKCQEVANEASHCCEECGTCNTQTPKAEKCHEKICNVVFDVCDRVHSTNSTECQERADVASDCCYNCLDCPSNVIAPTPERDHCFSNLCEDVYRACTKTDHHPDECRVAADHASDCCNFCNNCH